MCLVFAGLAAAPLAFAQSNAINTATITPPSGVVDANPGNDSATDDDGVARITATKSVASGPTATATANQFSIEYLIDVSNANGTAAGSYTLTDALGFDASGVTIDSVGAVSHSGTDPLSTALGSLTSAGGAIVTSETIAAGASESYRFTVTFTVAPGDSTTNTCAAGTAGNGLYNSATITPLGGVASSTSACADTPFVEAAPALTLVKTVTSGSPYAVVGDVVAYQYVVSNTGDVTLTAPITVSDDRIAAVSCPALPAGGLAPGASIPCTGSYTITQGDIDAGSVTNVASASDGTTTSADATATATGPTAAAPALTLVKTVTSAPVRGGRRRGGLPVRGEQHGSVTLTAPITVRRRQDPAAVEPRRASRRLAPGRPSPARAATSIHAG